MDSIELVVKRAQKQLDSDFDQWYSAMYSSQLSVESKVTTPAASQELSPSSLAPKNERMNSLNLSDSVGKPKAVTFGNHEF
jgi:hypothetical protein